MEIENQVMQVCANFCTILYFAQCGYELHLYLLHSLLNLEAPDCSSQQLNARASRKSIFGLKCHALPIGLAWNRSSQKVTLINMPNGLFDICVIDLRRLLASWKTFALTSKISSRTTSLRFLQQLQSMSNFFKESQVTSLLKEDAILSVWLCFLC